MTQEVLIALIGVIGSVFSSLIAAFGTWAAAEKKGQKPGCGTIGLFASIGGLAGMLVGLIVGVPIARWWQEPMSLSLSPTLTQPLSQGPTDEAFCPPIGSPEAMFAQPLDQMGTPVGSVGTGIFSHVVRPFGTKPTSYRYVRDALNEKRCVQYLTPSVLSDPTQSRHCMTSFYHTNRIWVGSTLAGTLIWYKAAASAQYEIIGRMDRIPSDTRAYLVEFEIQPGDEICLGAPAGKRLLDIIQAAGYHLWIGRDLATYINSWCPMLENDGSQHWCQ